MSIQHFRLPEKPLLSDGPCACPDFYYLPDFFMQTYIHLPYAALHMCCTCDQSPSTLPMESFITSVARSS